MRLLLDHERLNLEARQNNGNQALADDFRALIKTRFEVDITDVQPLTGGITKATVFRVFYSLKLRTVGEGGELRTETIHTSPGSLVIKRNLDSLQTAIYRYRSLPSSLKHSFAKHEGTPLLFQSDPAATHLILEDLMHMKTFRDVMGQTRPTNSFSVAEGRPAKGVQHGLSGFVQVTATYQTRCNRVLRFPTVSLVYSRYRKEFDLDVSR